MAVLVIGIGYLGAPLAEALLRSGQRVIALESGFSTDERFLRALGALPHVRVVRGSITDPAAVAAAFALAEPEAVFLLAAQASADPAAAPPSYTEDANLRGPRLVLEQAVRHRVQKLVYASSFRVYGDSVHGVVTEDRSFGRFRDLAHLTKCYAEKLVEMYAAAHHLNAASLRLGICYGVSPVMKRDYRFMTVPNKFALQATRGEPLVVHAAAHRPQAFVHVDDAVGAALQAVAALRSRWTGYVPVNVVSEVTTVREVAEWTSAAARQRGLHADIVELPNAAEIESRARAHASYEVASRLSMLGWQPCRRLATSAFEIVDHFLQPGDK